MTSRHASIAAALVLLPMTSFAADITDQEGAELRERAASLQAQRVQNPAWDGGTTRLNDSRGEVQLDRPRGDVKMKSASEAKAKGPKGQKVPREPATKKKKRSIADVPGALVRPR
jgi:hypothetical protein